MFGSIKNKLGISTQKADPFANMRSQLGLPKEQKDEAEWELLPPNPNSSQSTSPTNPSIAQQLGLTNGCCTLSLVQRLAIFALFLIAGAFMLMMAFFYLPSVIIGQTGKFALAYTLANIFILLSSCFLVGPSTQLASMFGKQRALVTIVYLSSLVGTLYAALEIRLFVVIVPMLIIQFGSLLWYVLSYLPYGTTGLTFVAKNARTLLPI